MFNAPPAPAQTTSTSTSQRETTAPIAANTQANAPATSSAAASSNSEKITITTDVYHLTFDTLGAQIIRAELLKLPDVSDHSKPTVLLNNQETQYTVQSGLIGPASQQKNYPNQNTPFTLTSQQTSLTGETLDVVFTAQADGLKVVRTYTFRKGSYHILVNDQITNISNEVQSPSQYLQITRDSHEPEGGSAFAHTYSGWAVYSDAGRFQKVTFDNIKNNKTDFVKTSSDGWVSFIQHFFVTTWIPPKGKEHYVDLRKIGENLYAVNTIEPLGNMAPGTSTSTQSSLWVGPQDQKALEKIDPTLDLVVDYGWLTIIAKPMFNLMNWIFTWVGNWGWTIVILTCIIKLILYPLSAASYKSMAKMKNVGPRMKALREQFGDDRQKLNAAMMEMYRTEKINPLGGCLPILVQIPVFLTLYRVLLASVEMRGAGWIGWITDLSVRDPYFILPAIMMATMFLQLKLNPTPPDPMQARIMMIMPIVFGGMMFMFPAGLVLYWVVNNILSITQQWYITRNLNKAANEQILTHK